MSTRSDTSGADDLILKITATAICGSDLHLYRGKVPELKEGDILSHEFMGVVVDAGTGVTKLQKGDRIVVPLVIACDHCFSATCNYSQPAKPQTLLAARS